MIHDFLKLQDHSQTKKNTQKKFFMGNGFVTTDFAEAANKLLQRDHKAFLHLLEHYSHGGLGAYFVPNVFFSEVPKVIDYGADKGAAYNAKYTNHIRGDDAEKEVYKKLKLYFEGNKDDVLILHSHKFLNDESNNEKDFILLNLSKGYILVVEVKSSSSQYAKGKKQLLDTKERIAEIVGNVMATTKWKFAGVFIAKSKSFKPMFNCEKCSLFTIIGIDNIAKQLPKIEKEILKRHEIGKLIMMFSTFILFMSSNNQY